MESKENKKMLLTNVLCSNKLFEKKKIGHEWGKTFAVNSPVITTLSATRKVNN